MPTILIKKSDTPGSVPGTANLTNLAGGAEVAVNTADRRMFTMNSSSAVVELGTNPSSLTCADGSFTLLKAASASITNLTATSLVLSNLSIASANVTTLTSASATITNLLATSLTVSGNTFLATSSGNVGIGTSSPSQKLEVAGAAKLTGSNLAIVPSTTTSAAYLVNTNAGGNFFLGIDNSTGGSFGAGAYGRILYSGGAYPIAFFTNDTERMRLDSSGNLGIGTSSPATRLHVEVTNTASSGTAAAIIRQNGAGNNGLVVDVASTPANYVSDFRINNSSVMRLDASGNLGVGLTSPAARSGGGGGVVDANGPVLARGALNADQTNAGILQYTSNETRIRSYGATAGTGFITFSTGGGGGSGDTERARITSGGDFGIGTSSPASILHVQKGNGVIRLDNGDGNYSTWQQTGSDTRFATASAIPLIFFTNANERARITSDGELLVNTTSSQTTKFASDGGAGGAVWGKCSTSGTAVNTTWNSATSGDNIFENFYTDGGPSLRGSIDYNRAGGQVRYNTTSDYRAKEVYGPVEDSGEQIDALKVYRGKMLGATQERPMMIAHEAQEVVPYAVSGEKDAVNEDGTPKYQNMDHQILVPLLIAELQSLRKRVAELETK